MSDRRRIRRPPQEPLTLSGFDLLGVHVLCHTHALACGGRAPLSPPRVVVGYPQGVRCQVTCTQSVRFLTLSMKRVPEAQNARGGRARPPLLPLLVAVC